MSRLYKRMKDKGQHNAVGSLYNIIIQISTRTHRTILAQNPVEGVKLDMVPITLVEK